MAKAVDATDRLTRSLSAAILLQWVGASAILPMLPLYLRRHGSSDALVGADMSAFFVAGLLSQYPAGRLADRIGRRAVLLAGLVLYAAGSVAFVASPGASADVVFRAIQGAGAGAAEVAALAMVADAVPLGRRGRASARIYGSMVAGLAIGPLLGSLAGESHMSVLFVAAGAASLLACVPAVGARARPARRVQAAHVHQGSLHVVCGGPGRGANRALVGALVAALATGLVSGIYETCWTLLLEHRHASSWEIGLSWTLFAVPFVTLTRSGGWLADHFDRRWLVAGALGAAAAICSLYPFLGDIRIMLALGTVEAACWAVAYPSAQSLLTQDVAGARMGEAQGLFASGQTGATALSAAAGGALFGIAPWIPFVWAAVAAALVLSVLPWLWRTVPGRVAHIALEDAKPGTPGTGQPGEAVTTGGRPPSR